MGDYKKRFARTLAETGALFFDKDLVLKDRRPTPYFVNMAVFNTGRLSIEMGSFFAGMMMSEELVKETDIILGPSYKGSTIALSTTIALWQDHEVDMTFELRSKRGQDPWRRECVKEHFCQRSFF